MNMTFKQILISAIFAAVAIALIHFGHGALKGLGMLAEVINWAIIFAAILAASALGGEGSNAGSAGTSSNSGTDDESEQGTVKWFNIKKGYGFITRDNGEDIFVHYKNINGDGKKVINEGQQVSFIVIDGDKGLQADEVEVIS